MNSSPKYINKGRNRYISRNISSFISSSVDDSTKSRFVDSFNDYRALMLNE